MRARLEDYQFTEVELQALRSLSTSPRSVSGLARAIHKKQPTVTKALRRLTEKGIVTLAREGMPKVVRFGDTKHAVLLRDILKRYSYMNWELLLSYSSMKVLFTIVSVGSLPRNLSRATLWRTLRNLMAHGIVVESNGKYSINERHRDLAEFVREFQSYLTSKLIGKVAPKEAVVVWKSSLEFIVRLPVQARVDEQKFQRTALSRFPEFSVPIVSEYEYYFYGKNKHLTLEDIVLHSLLIERDHLTYVTYALILLKKQMSEMDEAKLIRKAEPLGLGKQVKAMLHFLKMRETVEGAVLPEFKEFSAKASEYGV